ncbi:hypothetical protein FB451DRAFT_1255270 [Mycena latifolia]|nr:hypothetical protein FB451DRAFT_1255270 [Mycena latifolia]
MFSKLSIVVNWIWVTRPFAHALQAVPGSRSLPQAAQSSSVRKHLVHGRVELILEEDRPEGVADRALPGASNTLFSGTTVADAGALVSTCFRDSV